jgi:hypothetical protein
MIRQIAGNESDRGGEQPHGDSAGQSHLISESIAIGSRARSPYFHRETTSPGVRFAATFPPRSSATDGEQTIEQIISGEPAL